MPCRLVIIETSQRVGWVALADGPALLAQKRLDEARRHARDLAPALAQLLTEQGWKARDVEGVIVSRGPGSYTGLRVGIMSAKTLAYAAGCPLVGIDTFAAIARQAPSAATVVDVLADAQQRKIYVQRFAPTPGTSGWSAVTPLRIETLTTWNAQATSDVWLTGPGMETVAAQLTGANMVPAEDWLPRPESLLALGLERFESGAHDDTFALEPLYLRPSSAEEQWRRLGRL